MEQHGLLEYVEIRGWVRSTGNRATCQPFTLDGLTIEQWKHPVETITTQEWQRSVGHTIDVEVICTARSGLRRPIHSLDDVTQSPSYRRTRTDRLEEQHAVVRDRNEALGDKMEQLITR